MSLAAFKKDARAYTPRPQIVKEAPKKNRPFLWRIDYIKELKGDKKAFPPGETVADLDVVDLKTGICLQGITLVRYGYDTRFILPHYSQNLKARPQNERPRRLHLRLNNRKSADYFQSIMTRVVREYIDAHPGKLSKRCLPHIPEEVVQRIRDYNKNSELGKEKKRQAWLRHKKAGR